MTSRARMSPAIVRTSPQPKTLSSTHPRRPPAHKSVSLLHSRGSRPVSESASSSDSEKAQPSEAKRSPTATDSPSSLQAVGGKNSSGETSNAEKWFEKSNNEVRDSSITFVDNDPPFFMRNSSSESPPDPQNPHLRHLSIGDEHTNSLPLRTELLQLGTEGSSVEEFRSVIDDLTIENKKLKRRLKKYEKLHDSHLKDEKLFEVRIHGLPPAKKKELEETLRKFASSLGTTGANAFPVDGSSSLLPMLKPAKTASSQTSPQNADSAYASMSASGQGSSAQSGMDSKQKHTPTQYIAARRQNIHSYLHDIPEGLLPQQTPASMTERAKKKLVVRRMEQLFAGKGALSGGPQQSIQQQEVSQTAARADKTALEAQGQLAGKEGSREAHIMKQDAEEQMSSTENQIDETVPVKQSEKRRLPQQTHSKRLPEPSLAEQRPTRPLDLDPHRAQVPAENIRYMRQMGFSPQDPYAGRSPEDGHGWIFLNFLINMAQLHTINVTSDFVRKALGEYSNKFEVSSDGRRVRWKGGVSLTRNSSSGGSSNERMSNETPEGQSPRKRPKLTHGNVARSNFTHGGLSSHGAQFSRTESSRHVYTPLFAHRDESDTDDSSSSEDEYSEESPPLRAPITGDSSAMTSSGIRTSSGVPGASVRKKQKRDDGPIIFYNNARFCTDLSGDRKPRGTNGGPVYTPASSFPVGKPATTANKVFEKRGPLVEAASFPEPMDLSDNPIPESLEVSFPPDSPSKPPSSNGQDPIEFEVTGIGGVWPADNFSISVDSRHASTSDLPNANATRHLETKALPPRVRQILESSGITPKSHPLINKQFVASAVRGLPPSELPPAISFMPIDDESLEDDSDADDDEASEAPPSPGALPPSAAPQRVDFQYPLPDADDDLEVEDDSDDEESDDEVDFLATARQIDPEAVRQQEREYDANMAERLAEDIPAGSSAATAGGGSGFATPADDAESHELRRARHAARAQAANMARMKASDGVVVQARKNSSSGDSDEDEDDEMSDVRS